MKFQDSLLLRAMGATIMLMIMATLTNAVDYYGGGYWGGEYGGRGWDYGPENHYGGSSVIRVIIGGSYDNGYDFYKK